MTNDKIKSHFCLDFETTTENSRYFKRYNKPSIVVGLIQNVADKNMKRYVTNTREVIDFLVATGKSIKKPLTVWAHNLYFDFSYMLQDLLSFEDLTYIADPSRFNLKSKIENKWTFVMSDIPKKLYQVVIKMNGVKITMLDSVNFFTDKLDNILKDILGEGKVELRRGYETINPQRGIKEVRKKYPDFMTYLDRDVDGLARVIEKGIKENFFENKITKSSRVWNSSKKVVGKKEFKKNWVCLTEEEFEIGKAGVRGGFTNPNQTYIGKLLNDKTIYYDDFRSCYTDIIRGYLPVGKPYDFSIHKMLLKKDPNYKYAKFLDITITEATPIDPNYVEMIPLETKIYSKENYTHYIREPRSMFMWEGEFELWKRNYNMKYIIRKEYFVEMHIDPQFQSFILSSFALKSKFKKEGNKVVSNYYKDNCNCWSGKTAQDLRKNSRILEKCGKECELRGNKNHLIIADYHWKILEYKDKKVYNDTKDFNNVFTNIYITAKQRVQMGEIILNHPPEWLITDDTDSLIHFDCKYFNCKENCLPLGEELGMLEREHTVKSMKVLGAKNYVLFEVVKDGKVVGSYDNPYKITIAGFANASKKDENGRNYVNIDTYKDGHCFEKLVLKNKQYPTGTLLVSMDYNLTEKKYERGIYENNNQRC